MPNNTTPCAPKQRCGNVRTCEHCARRRQQIAADKAQKMAFEHGQLWLSVFTPHQNQAQEIRRIRAALLRKGFANKGMWSVETGEKFGGLHLNTITTRPTFSQINNADTHIERIATTARAAAAYITKQKGMPSTTQFSGKLLGWWGQAGQFATTQDAPPIIQAAALNDLLDTPDGPRKFKFSGLEEQPLEPVPELSREQYQALARKHLAALYAASERRPGALILKR